jgi:hypothetical protein
MELPDFVNQVSSFDAALPGEKIRLFAWFLHTYRNMDVFSTADIRGCYDKLHLPVPNVAMYLTRMTETNPPKALREGNNYKLTRAGRTDLDSKYRLHQTFVQVSKLLNELPGKVPDAAERNFLTEAIKCYQVGAFRACVVMTWNLTYAHLLHWILNNPARLAKFNASIPKRYPKKPPITIVNYDDFTEELKESEVVEVCGTASVLNSNVIRILREKLGKRNTAAHPSTITVVQSQADDVVTDLVNNVVITLT